MADFDLDFEVARDRLAEAAGLEPTPRPLVVPRDAKWEAWRDRFAAERESREVSPEVQTMQLMAAGRYVEACRKAGEWL